jgi:hypothetical protein
MSYLRPVIRAHIIKPSVPIFFSKSLSLKIVAEPGPNPKRSCPTQLYNQRLEGKKLFRGGSGISLNISTA